MIERKKIYSKMYRLAIVLTAIAFGTSCVVDETDSYILNTSKHIGFNAGRSKSGSKSRSMASNIAQNDPIQRIKADEVDFSIDVMVEDGIRSTSQSITPTTRGTQITTANGWNYRVAANYYPEGSSTPINFFLNDLTGLECSSDGTVTTPYYWPAMGQMEFFAITPSDIVFSETASAEPTISYTIPNDVAQQKDVMVAHTSTIDCNEENLAVGLGFEHLLAAVQFKVGKMLAVQITSLSISGVKGGTVYMDYNPGIDTWAYSPNDNNVTYTLITTTDGIPNIDTKEMTEGSYITGNDNGMTMFVMPQSLGADAKLNISYTESLTGTSHNVTAPLSGGTWQQGQTTTYILNIDAEHLTISLPAPPDADAHYVRVDLDYSLSGLDAYLSTKGFTISNIQAHATWEDNSITDAIYLKQSVKDSDGNVTSTELTTLQQQGYFTDEAWGWEYSVNNSGDKTYTVGSDAGPALVNDNILGETTINLANDSRGTIHLFLDENNSDAPRIGKLEMTARISGGGSSRDVTLGSGTFKQLCPSWNADGVGGERFEDDETFTYGFAYNRVVKYINPDTEGKDSWDDFSGWEKLVLFLRLLFTGSISNEVLPDMDEAATGFVNVEKLEDLDITKSITLNYGALNTVSPDTIAGNLYDGLANTTNLYNYTGSVDMTEFEKQLDETMVEEQGWEKERINEGTNLNTAYYAAYEALTRNRMRELTTIVRTSDDETTIVRAILHREGEGGTSNTGDETGDAIIEWYLPSITEAQSLKETGTGEETTPISPLDGTYWSSTAGADPDVEEGITSGYAYSYTYSDNSYTSKNANAGRADLLKVRAVRNK